MTRVLLTAFEPFDGREANASQQVADSLIARGVPGAELRSVVLPVSFRSAPERLAEALDDGPEVVVALGEAAGSTKLRFERVAINLIDARIPDNDGAQPIDAPVRVGGDGALFSSLPVKAMCRGARAAGMPSQVSHSAGTFVCNALFYRLMHAVADRPEVRAGFVHVPLAAPSPDPRLPALPLELMVRGLADALGRALDGPADLDVSAGRIH